MILIKFATEIKGQSTVDAHPGWINVESMQWGVGRGVASQTGGSAKREVSSPSISEVTFSRQSDMASPELFFQACGGVSLGKCEIHLLQVVENKPQVYLKIELEDALVSSYTNNHITVSYFDSLTQIGTTTLGLVLLASGVMAALTGVFEGAG